MQIHLLFVYYKKMLAFEAKDRPTVEEALSDPYFKNLAKAERETCAQPFSKREFEFEKRAITKEDIRERIYKEILEYHPNMLKDFLDGNEPTGLMYPSAVDKFKKQFSHLEEHHGKGTAAPPLERRHTLSLPRASILYSKETAQSAIEANNDHSRRSIKEAGSGCMTSGENGGTVASRDAQKNRILKIRSGSSAPVVRVSPSELVPRKTGHFPDRYME